MRYGIFDQIEIEERPLVDLYRDRLALVRAADDAGFERYHKSEHHMIGLDAIPQTGLFFAAAAQHTERIRFASLVYLLPFHHPIRLAEEICSLDHLLEGRFDVGVGRGISPPEHELWGLEPDRARENFDETLAVLRQALTTDWLTFHGTTYHFDEVPIVLRPYQQPTPPFWYAGNIAPAAAAGMSCVVGGTIAGIAQQVAAYREACAAAGHQETTIGGILTVYVAPTDAEARARVRDAWPVFTDHLRPLFRRWGLQPSPDPTLGGDVDRALDLGVLIAGSPATVREQLERFEAEAGTDYFVGKFTTGDLSHREVMRSIDLFATHVMDGDSAECPEGKPSASAASPGHPPPRTGAGVRSARSRSTMTRSRSIRNRPGTEHDRAPGDRRPAAGVALHGVLDRRTGLVVPVLRRAMARRNRSDVRCDVEHLGSNHSNR